MPLAVAIRILLRILLYQQALNLIQKHVSSDTAVSDIEIRTRRQFKHPVVSLPALIYRCYSFQGLHISIRTDNDKMIGIQIRQSLIGNNGRLMESCRGILAGFFRPISS